MKNLLARLAVVSFIIMLGTAAKAEDWQPIAVDGKEYLSLDNVAQFYHLKNSGEVGTAHVVLADGQPRLETLNNPRELLVNGAKEWLAFPTVFRDGQVLISRFDLAKTVEPSLRPAMIGNLEPFGTVVLDAGHGGQDGGGASSHGSEKNYTLDVVLNLKRSLEAKGLNVVLTRTEDAYLSLEQRADLANTIPDAVFVSVHFNSSGDAGAAGLEVYAMTPRGAASTGDQNVVLDQFKQMPGNDFDNASLAMANCVHHALLGNLSIADRGVRRARFAVLRLTHAPSILVEGGFMTNGVNSQDIDNPAWRGNFADAVAMGVKNYQDVVRYKQPPKLLADYRFEKLPIPTVTIAAAPTVSVQSLRPRLNLMPVVSSRSIRELAPSRPAGRMRRSH